MISNIHRVGMTTLLAALMLSATDCSVFVSTPRVARINIHRLDHKLVEYVVNLDDPTQSDIGIHLNSKYTLQLDFYWIWDMDDRSEIHMEVDQDFDEPKLSPWMLCKYRF